MANRELMCLSAALASLWEVTQSSRETTLVATRRRREIDCDRVRSSEIKYDRAEGTRPSSMMSRSLRA